MSERQKNSRSQAFTLVELLVVLALIMILLGIFVPSISKYVYNAKETNTKNTFISITAACQAYAKANRGLYPPSNRTTYRRYYYDSAGKLKSEYFSNLNYRGPSNKISLNAGGRSLLVDYLVGPTDLDGRTGPGYRSNRNQIGSRIIRPANGIEDIKVNEVEEHNYAFVDGWGNDIFYYQVAGAGKKDYYGNDKYYWYSLNYKDNPEGPSQYIYMSAVKTAANKIMSDEGLRFKFLLLSKGDKDADDEWSTVTSSSSLPIDYDDVSNVTTRISQ